MGFYPDTDAAACDLCHPTCRGCSGGLATNCLKCYPNAKLSGTAPNTCECNAGFFASPDSSNCLGPGCHDTCLTCSGTAAQNCLNCHVDATLMGAAPNFCRCDSGYFPNPDASECLACHSTCATCNGDSQTECLKCLPHASLDGSPPNSCSCNPNTTPTPDAANCVPPICHNTCQTC
jgi:proprotein convertase subtilisin/kexin type 5